MTEEEAKSIAAQLRRPHGDDGVQTAEWMNKGNLNMHLQTLDVVNPEANDNILEIGMGNGFMVRDILLKHESILYTGADFSQLMVEEASKLNADWIVRNRATFLCANAASLPLSANTYNKIFTLNTLYFWENPVQVLSQFRRVLKDKGQLYISFRPRHMTDKYPFVKFGFNQYSEQDVVDLLATNGFMVQDVYDNKEPDIELHGEIMKVGHCVVVGRKDLME